jgi:hypothetical protein
VLRQSDLVADKWWQLPRFRFRLFAGPEGVTPVTLRPESIAECPSMSSHFAGAIKHGFAKNEGPRELTK